MVTTRSSGLSAIPGSDGRVGLFSGSYVGATQMLAAIAHPPHLAGICPVVTASSYHENWTWQGGAFEQWFNQSWTSGLAQDTMTRLVSEHRNARVGEQTLPLTEFPVFNFGPGSIESGTVLTGGSLRNYMGMRDHAGNAEARAKQRLVVAIGGHSGWTRQVGIVDFGPDAPFDENEITIEWYEYLFLSKQNQFADGSKPVHIFVMGKNQWRSEAAGHRRRPSLFTTTWSPRERPIRQRATALCLRRRRLALATALSTTLTIRFRR